MVNHNCSFPECKSDLRKYRKYKNYLWMRCFEFLPFPVYTIIGRHSCTGRKLNQTPELDEAAGHKSSPITALAAWPASNKCHLPREHIVSALLITSQEVGSQEYENQPMKHTDSMTRRWRHGHKSCQHITSKLGGIRVALKPLQNTYAHLLLPTDAKI